MLVGLPFPFLFYTKKDDAREYIARPILFVLETSNIWLQTKQAAKLIKKC